MREKKTADREKGKSEREGKIDKVLIGWYHITEAEWGCLTKCKMCSIRLNV